jgi:alpha-L-rhamnosidase
MRAAAANDQSSKTAQIAFRKANWIWLDGEPCPRNAVAEFRHSFDLERMPRNARVLVSADSRYVLWINGTRIGHGPPRNFPNHYEFDLHDVAGFLRRGQNTLRVIVQHWGEGNFQAFVRRAGLVLEIQAGATIRGATDSSWECRLSPGYEAVTPRIACQLPFEEQAVGLDANEQEAGWCPAVAIGPVGCKPWGQLNPRSIPALTDEPWECVTATGAGLFRDAVLITALRAGLVLASEDLCSNVMRVQGTFVTALHVPRDGTVWIKYGAMYSGPISMRIDGKPLSFRQDTFDLQAEMPVKRGVHELLVDWNGLAHDLDLGIAIGGIPGIKQVRPRDDTGALWLFLPKSERKAAQRNGRNQPSDSGTAVDLTSGAVPKHDTYMAVTCRTPLQTGSSGPIQLPLTVEPARSSTLSQRFILDFGRMTNGFVEIDLDAGKDTLLEGAGIEGMMDGQVQFTELANNSFRYRCREGRQTFTSLQPRGLRFLVLDVKPGGRPAKLLAARMRVSTYPWHPLGSFRCSDTRLNQIYELCTHTLRMCSMDTFVDAPYEQALWVGDAASMAVPVHNYVQGERLLPERSLRLAAQSLERTPLVNSQVPSAWENRLIPNWSFLWALGVRDHFRFHGELDFAREMLPSMEKQCRFIEQCRNGEGLFALDENVWHFLDWNGCEDDHKSSTTRTYASENALAVASFQATAEIAAALGYPEKAKRWSSLALRLARATRQCFWNQGATAFSETRSDGRTSQTITASTQICALMANLFPSRLARVASRRVIAPPSSWMPTGTPWMWALGARFSLETGDADPVLNTMRQLWGGMLDRGATTAWEMFEGRHRPGLPTRSWCHAWSAGPAWLLPAYILGARPAEPGWTRAIVQPLPGDLQWAEGSIPTPHGILHIRWEKSWSGKLRIKTKLPAGVKLLSVASKQP